MKIEGLAQVLTIPKTVPSGAPAERMTITGIPDFRFNENGIGGIISNLIPLLITIAGVGLLLMILLSGFNLLTSAGDAKKMEGEKNRLTFALVGFFIVFLSYWIVQLFGIIFGLDSIKQIFGS